MVLETVRNYHNTTGNMLGGAMRSRAAQRKAEQKMRSMTELIEDSRNSQVHYERSLETRGISASIVHPKPINNNIMIGLMKLNQPRKKREEKTAHRVTGKLNEQSQFEKVLRALDPAGTDKLLMTNEKAAEIKSVSEPTDATEQINLSSLSDVPTSPQEYAHFWDIVNKLIPKASLEDGPMDMTLEKRLHLSLEWLAQEHGTTLGDGEDIRKCGNTKTRLITLEQYVRISQTTISVLLNDSQDASTKSNASFSNTVLNNVEQLRNVMIPHVSIWVAFEAARCLESDVLKLIGDLAQKAKSERRTSVLNESHIGSNVPYHHSNEVGARYQDFLALNSLTLSDLECLVPLVNSLALRCDQIKKSIQASGNQQGVTIGLGIDFHRDSVDDAARLVPLRNPSSFLQNPMGGLLLSLVDPSAAMMDVYSWPTLSLFNAGKLKRRSCNLNVEVILRDFILGWPWYRLFKTVLEVDNLRNNVQDLKQVVGGGHTTQEGLTAVEETIQKTNTELFNDLMAWHQRGVPSFKGVPFCSASTFASLLTIVGRSELGIKALLQAALGAKTAGLVSEVHAHYRTGGLMTAADVLISVLASPIIYTPGMPDQLDQATLWTRQFLKDTALELIKDNRLTQEASTDLQIMLTTASVLENFLLWPDHETLSLMGRNELVPLDKETYLGWCRIEPSLGLRLLEVYVYALHKSFARGYWSVSVERLKQLQTVGYHLNTMCDIITQHVDPSVHSNSVLTIRELGSILDGIKSKVVHINVYSSGKVDM